jgi:AcrR family transcriptional regulator
VVSVNRPAPGKRVANRRELIVAAAAELIAERGFESVSMGDIASAVAVGPSALYRHFAGKDEVLVEVIAGVIERFLGTLEEGMKEPRDLIERIAAFALDERSAGILWQREARHLPATTYAPLRAQMRRARDTLADALQQERELRDSDARVLAVAVLGVLFSPSFHHVDLPRPAFERRLAQIAAAVLDVDTRSWSAEKARPRAGGLSRVARREQILDVALRLFAEGTFASVGLEEIAASAGLAVSSVYNHFPAKVDLLSVALLRGNGYLQLSLEHVLRAAPDERRALADLVDVYSSFAVDQPAIVDVLITEIRSLAPVEAAALVAAQRDYVAEWVHLYRALHPAADRAEAGVVVQAALMLINDLARTRDVRAREGANELLSGLARAVLGL